MSYNVRSKLKKRTASKKTWTPSAADDWSQECDSAKAFPTASPTDTPKAVKGSIHGACDRKKSRIREVDEINAASPINLPPSTPRQSTKRHAAATPGKKRAPC